MGMLLSAVDWCPIAARDIQASKLQRAMRLATAKTTTDVRRTVTDQAQVTR